MTLVARQKTSESKARYIWRVGILRWALPLFVLFMVMETFVLRRHQQLTAANFADVALIAAIVWLITGWFFGSIMWRRRQKLSQNSANERN